MMLGVALECWCCSALLSAVNSQNSSFAQSSLSQAALASPQRAEGIKDFFRKVWDPVFATRALLVIALLGARGLYFVKG